MCQNYSENFYMQFSVNSFIITLKAKVKKTANHSEWLSMQLRQTN